MRNRVIAQAMRKNQRKVHHRVERHEAAMIGHEHGGAVGGNALHALIIDAPVDFAQEGEPPTPGARCSPCQGHSRHSGVASLSVLAPRFWRRKSANASTLDCFGVKPSSRAAFSPETVQLYCMAWRFTPPGSGRRPAPAARNTFLSGMAPCPPALKIPVAGDSAAATSARAASCTLMNWTFGSMSGERNAHVAGNLLDDEIAFPRVEDVGETDHGGISEGERGLLGAQPACSGALGWSKRNTVFRHQAGILRVRAVGIRRTAQAPGGGRQGLPGPPLPARAKDRWRNPEPWGSPRFRAGPVRPLSRSSIVRLCQ